ncbi:MAG: methyl-accepting chemotaxis protein [Campylobacterota bacterium]|nr:methyl-accepting chemotaxis protein [Campylobacterota bacterium]
MEKSKPLIGRMKIRTKIILPTVIILVLSNLLSVFTSAYKMDDLAKSNAKLALNQLTDSIFLNLRTAMNTGDSTIIEDTEKKSRDEIKGLEKLVVSRSKDMISLFSPQLSYTTDTETLKVFQTKQTNIIESFENDKHTLRSLKPMIATNECVTCHINQKVGDVIGVMDLTFNLEESDNIINGTVLNLVMQALVVLAFITIFMTILIRKATRPIDVFQKGLESFFMYVNKETKEVGHIEGYTNDEIGNLVDSVNRNIDETVKGVEKDQKLIDDAKEVCKKASLGVYDVKITAIPHSPELNELKDLVNKLIDAVGYNMNRISTVLNSYDEDNYKDRINSSGSTTGTMKAVFDKVDALGDSLTKGATQNLVNGKKLENDANVLEDAVSNIQSFLNKQSVELDRSVDELDIITKNIRQTTSDAISMDNYAKNVTASVKSGQKLATQTTQEMDEIALEVNSISDAITIIDQIAFQTNILSLNAAVEAATAGEAGKGFAVVAQEVRNLANRSAQAAKEIKALVESATSKANGGKVISDEMIKGYNELNEHINSTIELIQNVTTASQTQQQSIEQINTNMNLIKNDTAQSTQMTQDALEIAHKTSELANTIVDEASNKKI